MIKPRKRNWYHGNSADWASLTGRTIEVLHLDVRVQEPGLFDATQAAGTATLFRNLHSAAKKYRMIEKQREQDEDEHCAGGATYGLGELNAAAAELDAAIAALADK